MWDLGSLIGDHLVFDGKVDIEKAKRGLASHVLPLMNQSLKESENNVRAKLITV